MQTKLSPEFSNTAMGRDAAQILQRCVHCGFCTATCPTYQLLGDELDGPRGRIHLIGQMLEGEAATAVTREHLDRCLTCRACETTCPSGVEYGRLLDIGREVIEHKAPRAWTHRLGRRALAAFLTGPLFSPALRVARLVRGVLPARISARVPVVQPAGAWPAARHARRMLLLGGCVHDALSPRILAATARVFDRLGISLIVASSAGCCGAIRHHLADAAGARDDLRRNVDAWWPAISAGAEAVVAVASGCGTMLRDYGHLLREDSRYAERAARISALARDPSELLQSLVGELQRQLPDTGHGQRLAFHSPCSLQHGLRIRGPVESVLKALGAELVPVQDAHLCCGSAGTYSLLQPAIAGELGRAKAAALAAAHPDAIVSANIGCIVQVGTWAEVPVLHWLEWVDARLSAAAP